VNGTRKIFVGFADEKIRKSFDDLKKGKGAELHLYDYLNRAFDDLKKDPFSGIKIPKKESVTNFAETPIKPVQ